MATSKLGLNVYLLEEPDDYWLGSCASNLEPEVRGHQLVELNEMHFAERFAETNATGMIYAGNCTGKLGCCEEIAAYATLDDLESDWSRKMLTILNTGRVPYKVVDIKKVFSMGKCDPLLERSVRSLYQELIKDPVTEPTAYNRTLGYIKRELDLEGSDSIH